MLWWRWDKIILWHKRRSDSVATMGVWSFFIEILCGSHKTNLAMHVVSKTTIVSKEEAFLSALHAYFSKSLKKSLEFSTRAEIMVMKGLKILKHYKTC